MTSINAISTSDAVPTAATAISKPAAKPVVSKSAAVVKLLDRPRGATVAEMMAATDWQPHSVRAYLSGLRKKGSTLTREPRKSGEQAYRLTSEVPIALPAKVNAPSVEA